MRYRAPLLHPEQQIPDPELFRLLTDAQMARFSVWSIQTGAPVLDLLQRAGFMAEQIREDSHLVSLQGLLPHCGLHGCLMPDGSCHT